MACTTRFMIVMAALSIAVPVLSGCLEEARSGGAEAKRGSPPQGTKGRQRPEPPGSKMFAETRERMVRTQMSAPRDGRTPVRSEAVLATMRIVPRHVFVPERVPGSAYADSPLPIGHGQTISQPYIVAFMTEHLQLRPDSKVLEIGTGSGYQAAVLAHLTKNVYSIEIVEPLAKRARRTLEEQSYNEVKLRVGDGYFGWPEEAPFDAIIVTCAAGHLPPPLWKQLKPGGRILVPIGGPYEVQRLVQVTKTEDGKRRSKSLMAVRFVPLTRGGGERSSREQRP